MVEISWNKKVLPLFFQNKKESQRGGMIWISWNKRFCLFSLHNWNQSENFHTKFATLNINSFQRIGWKFEEANPSIPRPAPKYILERKKVHTAALRKVLFHNMCCLPPLMWGKENMNRTIPSTTCGESKGPHTHTHTQIPSMNGSPSQKKVLATQINQIYGLYNNYSLAPIIPSSKEETILLPIHFLPTL